MSENTLYDSYKEIVQKTSGMNTKKQKFYRGRALLNMLDYDELDMGTVDVDVTYEGINFDYKLISDKLITFVKFRDANSENTKISLETSEIDGKPVVSVGVDGLDFYITCKKYGIKVKDTCCTNSDKYIVMLSRVNKLDPILTECENAEKAYMKTVQALVKFYETGVLNDYLAEALKIKDIEKFKVALSNRLIVKNRPVEKQVEQHTEQNASQQNASQQIENKTPVVEKKAPDGDFEDGVFEEDDEDLFGMSYGREVSQERVTIPSVKKELPDIDSDTTENNSSTKPFSDDPFAS